MSALTIPARPEEEDADLRPVPWQRMAGVTWRQHRFTLAGVAVLLGALAGYLWLVGLQVHHAFAAATTCQPTSSATCQSLVIDLQGLDNFLANGLILQVIPVLIGAFVGAPVLARELETGTFRYAWTQGFGRRRWALAKLVSLAAAVTLAAWLFSLLLSWYYQPYFAASSVALGLPGVTTPFFPGLFDLHGVTFAAWTLVAFAIGALAGMLIRRVVPAIAVTIAAYTGLAFAAGGLLRSHYLSPLLTTATNVPGNAWILSQWYTQHGRFAESFPPVNLMNQYCQILPPGSGKPAGKPSWATFAQCLAQHGVTQWTSYQPATRFWPFQWIESGWLLALSVLLITAAIWLVHRRAT
jgi:ABC-2 family transporter protein